MPEFDWFHCLVCDRAAIRCPHCDNTSCNGGGCSLCDADFLLASTMVMNGTAPAKDTLQKRGGDSWEMLMAELEADKRKPRPMTADTCHDCGEAGCSGDCLFVDGRNLEVVSEYASTCDGCAQLTSHEMMAMDPATQLGYCQVCVGKNEVPPAVLVEAREKFPWLFGK